MLKDFYDSITERGFLHQTTDANSIKKLFDKLKDSQKTFKRDALTGEILNKTFNEVLMRSINTSFTSAIPIISIIFIGNYLGIEGNLSDFAIPLLIGILSGTYSSIFVTVPFLSKIIKS